MKIDGFGAIHSTGGTQKKRGVSGGGSFADLLSTAESDASGVSHAGDASPASPVNNFLALQEISEDELQRKKLVQQGNNMLDVLEKLRRQILVGTLSPQTLRDITAQLASQKQMVNDPKLMGIIEDIELRAAVELAKLQMSLPRPTID